MASSCRRLIFPHRNHPQIMLSVPFVRGAQCRSSSNLPRRLLLELDDDRFGIMGSRLMRMGYRPTQQSLALLEFGALLF